MKMSLERRFLLPLSLILVVGLGLMMGLSYDRTRDLLDGLTRKELRQSAERLTVNVDDWISTLEVDVNMWTSTAYCRNVSRNPGDAKFVEDANGFFMNIVDKYPFYQSANILDLAGDVIASSVPTKVGHLNLADRDYFKTAKTGVFVVSRPLVSRATFKPF